MKLPSCKNEKFLGYTLKLECLFRIVLWKNVQKYRKYNQISGVGAGASWRALGLKTADAHSTRSLKISGCKRWCPKDLRVRAPVLTHSLQTAILLHNIMVSRNTKRSLTYIDSIFHIYISTWLGNFQETRSSNKFKSYFLRAIKSAYFFNPSNK